GRVEDVTDFAKYTASNDSVAKLDRADSNVVTVMGPGEGAISAWYLSKLVIAHVTVPYPNQLDPKVLAESPKQNFIDKQVMKKLASLNLPPSPIASDREFLRRAYLDTTGTLPTLDE